MLDCVMLSYVIFAYEATGAIQRKYTEFNSEINHLQRRITKMFVAATN